MGCVGLQEGLATMAPFKNTMILLSAQPGVSVPEKHSSAFGEELAGTMSAAGALAEPLQVSITRVVDSVSRRTGGEVHPSKICNLNSNMYLC